MRRSPSNWKILASPNVIQDTFPEQTHGTLLSSSHPRTLPNSSHPRICPKPADNLKATHRRRQSPLQPAISGRPPLSSTQNLPIATKMMIPHFDSPEHNWEPKMLTEMVMRTKYLPGQRRQSSSLNHEHHMATTEGVNNHRGSRWTPSHHGRRWRARKKNNYVVHKRRRRRRPQKMPTESFDQETGPTATKKLKPTRFDPTEGTETH